MGTERKAPGIRSARELGARLRSAREAAGLSTRVVARKLQTLGLGASHTTVANYELGKALPTTAIIDALAGIYERPQAWFMSSGPTLTDIRYRCLKSARVSEKRQYENNALAWLQAYLHVEQVLGRPLKRSSFTIRPGESGRALAERIRKKFHFGMYPIPSVIRLLEEFGIHVIQLDTPSRIDGFAGVLDNLPVVVLNSSLPNDRIRLNAAHELAHHLFKDGVSEEYLSNEEIERRAFECASYLLIPEDQLQAAFELKSMVRLVQYKERFGISLAAMIYRARISQFIDQRLYERLWREFGKLGWRKEEPGHVPPDRPVRMEALIDAAVGQGKVSYTDVARLARVGDRVVRQRVMRAMGGSIEHSVSYGDSTPTKYQSYWREHATKEDA